jgi:NADPH:quinone reductase-like Zn-dependent oxidoreductase
MTISACPNSGDDIAGIVEGVGSDVQDFRVGDRVAALHELGSSHGSYAEYAIAYSWTTFLLDKDTSFEQGATIPMVAFMASLGLFAMLRITPGPWIPRTNDPLLVYGAASSVGSAVIRQAQIADIHPLICVAGHGIPLVETLIDAGKGDVIIDYRNGPEEVEREIKKALRGRKLNFVFDAISEQHSHRTFANILDPATANVTFVLGGYRDDIPAGVQQSTTMVGSFWRGLTPVSERDKLGLGAGGKDFGFAYSRLIGWWLQQKKLKIHPYEVMDGGLMGLESALKRLRSGTSSAKKLVIRIADTPGI